MVKYKSMNKNRGSVLISALVMTAVVVASAIGGALIVFNKDNSNELQGFNPAGGLTYRLQSSIGSTNTSIKLSSFKNRSDIPLTMTNMDTDIGYGTIDPSRTRSEFISFTGVTQNSDGTALLTGVTRGISDLSPYAASTTLRNSHPGQSIFILSDSPKLFSEYTKRRTNEDVTGQWDFDTNLPESTLTATTSAQFTTKTYVDNKANAGAATSTESVSGIVELATRIESASSTPSTTDTGYVQQAEHATSSPDVRQLNDVWSENDGYLDQDWIDLTEDFTLTGDTTLASTTVTELTAATTTVSTTLDVTATTTTANLVVSNSASTTDLTVSGTCYGCVEMFISATTTNNDWTDTTETVNVGFRPRYIQLYIYATDANEGMSSHYTWMDPDGDGTGTGYGLQYSGATGSDITKPVLNAIPMTDSFTDGYMQITLTNVTSTSFDLFFDRADATNVSQANVKIQVLR